MHRLWKVAMGLCAPVYSFLRHFITLAVYNRQKALSPHLTVELRIHSVGSQMLKHKT